VDAVGSVSPTDSSRNEMQRNIRALLESQVDVRTDESATDQEVTNASGLQVAWAAAAAGRWVNAKSMSGSGKQDIMVDETEEVDNGYESPCEHDEIVGDPDLDEKWKRLYTSDGDDHHYPDAPRLVEEETDDREEHEAGVCTGLQEPGSGDPPNNSCAEPEESTQCPSAETSNRSDDERESSRRQHAENPITVFKHAHDVTVDVTDEGLGASLPRSLPKERASAIAGNASHASAGKGVAIRPRGITACPSKPSSGSGRTSSSGRSHRTSLGSATGRGGGVASQARGANISGGAVSSSARGLRIPRTALTANSVRGSAVVPSAAVSTADGHDGGENSAELGAAGPSTPAPSSGMPSPSGGYAAAEDDCDEFLPGEVVFDPRMRSSGSTSRAPAESVGLTPPPGDSVNTSQGSAFEDAESRRTQQVQALLAEAAMQETQLRKLLDSKKAEAEEMSDEIAFQAANLWQNLERIRGSIQLLSEQAPVAAKPPTVVSAACPQERRHSSPATGRPSGYRPSSASSPSSRSSLPRQIKSRVGSLRQESPPRLSDTSRPGAFRGLVRGSGTGGGRCSKSTPSTPVAAATAGTSEADPVDTSYMSCRASDTQGSRSGLSGGGAAVASRSAADPSSASSWLTPGRPPVAGSRSASPSQRRSMSAQPHRPASPRTLRGGSRQSSPRKTEPRVGAGQTTSSGAGVASSGPSSPTSRARPVDPPRGHSIQTALKRGLGAGPITICGGGASSSRDSANLTNTRPFATVVDPVLSVPQPAIWKASGTPTQATSSIAKSLPVPVRFDSQGIPGRVPATTVVTTAGQWRHATPVVPRNLGINGQLNSVVSSVAGNSAVYFGAVAAPGGSSRVSSVVTKHS